MQWLLLQIGPTSWYHPHLTVSRNQDGRRMSLYTENNRKQSKTIENIRKQSKTNRKQIENTSENILNTENTFENTLKPFKNTLHLHVCLFVCLSVCLSICMSVCYGFAIEITNNWLDLRTIEPQFFSFGRILPVLKKKSTLFLRTSKTQLRLKCS